MSCDLLVPNAYVLYYQHSRYVANAYKDFKHAVAYIIIW